MNKDKNGLINDEKSIFSIELKEKIMKMLIILKLKMKILWERFVKIGNLFTIRT